MSQNADKKSASKKVVVWAPIAIAFLALCVAFFAGLQGSLSSSRQEELQSMKIISEIEDLLRVEANSEGEVNFTWNCKESEFYLPREKRLLEAQRKLQILQKLDYDSEQVNFLKLLVLSKYCNGEALLKMLNNPEPFDRADIIFFASSMLPNTDRMWLRIYDLYKSELRLDPVNHDLRVYWAIHLIVKENYKDAEEQLKTVLEAEPNHENALYNMSIVLTKSSRGEELKTIFDGVNFKKVINPLLLVRYGRYLYVEKDYRESINALMRAIERGDREARTFEYIADSYRELGNKKMEDKYKTLARQIDNNSN